MRTPDDLGLYLTRDPPVFLAGRCGALQLCAAGSACLGADRPCVRGDRKIRLFAAASAVDYLIASITT